MVTGVTTLSPTAYLNQVKGITHVTPPSTPPATSGTTSTTPTTGTTGSTSGSTTPSLNNLLGLSSSLLNLLQGTSAGSGNSNLVSSLFGSSATSSSDPLAGVYSTLLYNASSVAPLAQAVQAAQNQQANTTAQTTNPLQNVLSSFNAAANAYNQTLEQNAQSVAATNNYQADGKTKLVA